MSSARWAGVIAVAVVIWAVGPVSAKEVPYLSGRVIDEAGMLSRATEERLMRALQELEQNTGAQVVVLTVESLDGDLLEDYSHRVAETWALGQKGQDNGALFLIAKAERRMRIEVGYGLEGTLPDALAGRILNDIVTAHFRRSDFDRGVEAGVEAIVAVLGGDPEAVKAVPHRTRVSGAAVGTFTAIIVLIGILVLEISLSRQRRRWGGRGVRGPTIFPWGGGFGGGSGGFGGGFGGFSGGGGSFGGGGASGGW
jgi:uncharacterized protein